MHILASSPARVLAVGLLLSLHQQLQLLLFFTATSVHATVAGHRLLQLASFSVPLGAVVCRAILLPAALSSASCLTFQFSSSLPQASRRAITSSSFCSASVPACCRRTTCSSSLSPSAAASSGSCRCYFRRCRASTAAVHRTFLVHLALPRHAPPFYQLGSLQPSSVSAHLLSAQLLFKPRRAQPSRQPLPRRAQPSRHSQLLHGHAHVLTFTACNVHRRLPVSPSTVFIQAASLSTSSSCLFPFV